jgi:hypothetical protein
MTYTQLVGTYIPRGHESIQKEKPYRHTTIANIYTEMIHLCILQIKITMITPY